MCLAALGDGSGGHAGGPLGVLVASVYSGGSSMNLVALVGSLWSLLG